MAENRIKRTEGRSWNGNGFGYTPASYAVERDGRIVLRIVPDNTWGYHVYRESDKGLVRENRLTFSSIRYAEARKLALKTANAV